MIERLRRCRFDAAVIFTVFSQSPLPAALMCHLAGIPLRLARCRENPYHLLTDWVQEDEPQGLIRHEVRRQLDLVAGVGYRCGDDGLVLSIPAAARDCAAALLRDLGLDGSRRWLLIHPGASAPSRRYPVELFAQAASDLMEKHRLRVVFTGDASEVELVAEIRRRISGPSISTAGALRLPEFAAVVAQAPLLLTNNSGPVHIAAAVGTPVVDLYALTNPQHTPWNVAHRTLYHDVDCKYCFKSVCPMLHHGCLRGVAPSRVVEAVVELMDATALRPQDPSLVSRLPLASTLSASSGPVFERVPKAEGILARRAEFRPAAHVDLLHPHENPYHVYVGNQCRLS